MKSISSTYGSVMVILMTSLTAGFRASLLQRAGLSVATSQGLAVGKVLEAVVAIPTVLLLSLLAGMSLKSLYVQRGDLKWGLILGIGLLVNFCASALMFFYGRFTSPEALVAALVWGLVFSLANGFMEELWLRAQFLGKLEPLIGPGMAIGLTALWWSIFHVGAVYFSPVAVLFFLLNLMTFGLAFGYTMKKTDSWIGPGLMHAASDLFLFIATLSSTS
jgi:membrane protease YdiL (CAAX protease family)